MFIQKCSIQDCDIMAPSLLMHVTTKDFRYYVCAQHLQEFAKKLYDQEPLDAYPGDFSGDEYESCCLCPQIAVYNVATETPTYHRTYLCQKHVFDLFFGRFAAEEKQKLKNSHPEIVLHNIT